MQKFIDSLLGHLYFLSFRFAQLKQINISLKQTCIFYSIFTTIRAYKFAGIVDSRGFIRNLIINEKPK